MQQRIVRLLGLHFFTRQVSCGHIGAGMAVKTDGAEVQEGGLLAVADIGGGFGGDAEGIVEVQTVGLEIFQAGTGGEGGLDPALRRLGGNADAVVFADKKKGQGDRLIAGPLRGVEGALRGGVVGAGVAKAAIDDGVVGQDLVFRLVAPGGADGIGGADRLGQVAGDGRGLRRDEEVAGTQNLVAPAGNGIVGGRGEREQHVPGRVLPRNLRRPRDLEGGIAVVEEGHVGRAQRKRHRRQPLMP